MATLGGHSQHHLDKTVTQLVVARAGWPRSKKGMNPMLTKIVELHNNTWSQPLNANPYTIMMMSRKEIDVRNTRLKSRKAPVARKAPKQMKGCRGR